MKRWRTKADCVNMSTYLGGHQVAGFAEASDKVHYRLQHYSSSSYDDCGSVHELQLSHHLTQDAQLAETNCSGVVHYGPLDGITMRERDISFTAMLTRS